MANPVLSLCQCDLFYDCAQCPIKLLMEEQAYLEERLDRHREELAKLEKKINDYSECCPESRKGVL